jgi:hypothetical protein
VIVPPLPAPFSMRGGSPELVGRELMEAITNAIVNHPRSLQTRIGPSEIGTECARKIAYKLLDFPEREMKPNWKATVGTAIHAWLETVLAADNARWLAQSGHERWVIEQRVPVGALIGVDLDGNCDVYDRVTAGVVDWKTTSKTRLRTYRSKGPGNQYRVQAHTYGYGWTLLGHPVDYVMIVFLPRDGELADAYIWFEPYDQQIALDGMQRANGIALTVEALGADALAHFPVVDNFCGFCPYHRPNSPDPKQGCEGYPRNTKPAFSDILGG